MANYVITIARTCGSGGSYIGEELSKKLGIKLYEQDILQLASEESGISLDLFARTDEELKMNPLFRFSKYIYSGELIPPSSSEFTSEENRFNYQAKVLKGLAEKESYIVIGRCADFVLKDRTDFVRFQQAFKKRLCLCGKIKVVFNHSEFSVFFFKFLVGSHTVFVYADHNGTLFHNLRIAF